MTETNGEWSGIRSSLSGALIRFTNHDTGGPEWVRIDNIIRVSECQHPDHKGFALLSIQIGLEVALIEADSTVEEFVDRLREALDG